MRKPRKPSRVWRRFVDWISTDDPNLDAPNFLDLADGVGRVSPEGRLLTWAELEADDATRTQKKGRV